MEFKNRENKVYQTEDGPVWASRSVAIVGILLFNIGGRTHVLAEKRSQKMDMPGSWCAVSGYIDWDENSIQCLLRETFEEAGLDLEKLNDDLIFFDNQPFYVRTDVDENRQNITLNYVAYYNMGDDGHWRLIEAERHQDEEIDEIRLIPLDTLEDYEWAFEHDLRIMQGYLHFMKEFHEQRLLKNIAKELEEIREAVLEREKVVEGLTKEIAELTGK